MSLVDDLVLARIPVDLLPNILRYIAGEKDFAVIGVLERLGCVAFDQTNNYWLAVCREIAQRPNLPFVIGVNYEWICRLLTCVSNGEFRKEFGPQSPGYPTESGRAKNVSYAIDSKLPKYRCTSCRSHSPPINYVVFELTVARNMMIARIPKRAGNCNAYIPLVEALLAFQALHRRQDVLITTLEYFFKRFHRYDDNHCCYTDVSGYLCNERLLADYGGQSAEGHLELLGLLVDIGTRG